MKHIYDWARKNAKTILPLLIVAVLSVSLGCTAVTAADEDFGGCEICHSDIAETFSTTLHYTGAGMKGEYARHAAEEFGIDMDEYYTKWNCSKCHITTCEKCHVGYEAKIGHGDQTQEITIDTCDPCHKPKQTSTFVGDMPMHKEPGPHADVHYEKGLICTDCHGAADLHGDGTYHKSIDDPGAVKAKCEDCHKASDIMAHTIHGDTLDCTACHTGWQLNCKGCHLETRPPYTGVSDEFYLGVRADGKITPFLKMESEYKNETHIAYGAYFTHAVTKEAKDCAFCHENPEVLCEGCEGAIHEEGASFIPQEMIDKVLAVDLSAVAKTPAEVAKETPTAAAPVETPTAKPPGFELIFAVIAIAVVVVLAKRRR